MTVKAYLKQAFTLDARVRSLKEQILKHRELQTAVNAILPRDKVQTSPERDRTGRIMGELEALENRFILEVTRLLVVKGIIADMVERLEDPRQKLVMTERYLNLKTWEGIAEDLNYSADRVYQIHGEALKKITVNYSKKCGIV